MLSLTTKKLIGVDDDLQCSQSPHSESIGIGFLNLRIRNLMELAFTEHRQ